MDEKEKKQFRLLLPFWKDLEEEQRVEIDTNAKLVSYGAGEQIHGGRNDCTGVIVVKEGELRAYILSESGKEITLYRLKKGDICILSASCILRNINFELSIEAEKDTMLYLIAPKTYEKIKNKNHAVEKWTNETMNERFSETMWIMEQILFMSVDKRLAIFLLDESIAEKSDTISLTHETIAKHMGTAREVVSRMLKHFQNNGLVTLSRGGITIKDKSGLRKLT